MFLKTEEEERLVCSLKMSACLHFYMGMGMIFAIFILLGNMPGWNDWLHIWVIGFAIVSLIVS